jgi:hypothetical protein
VVLAVEVLYGINRPYFTGPAFIREGSSNKKASEQIFEELIASRHDKARVILKSKGKAATVVAKRKRLGDTGYLGDNRYEERHECTVKNCTPHYVELYIVNSGRHVTEPLGMVSISKDENRGSRLMLIIEAERS